MSAVFVGHAIWQGMTCHGLNLRSVHSPPPHIASYRLGWNAGSQKSDRRDESRRGRNWGPPPTTVWFFHANC